MQVSRARTDLKKMNVPEAQWPPYDEACRAAHAEYTGRWREAGGSFGTPPGPKPKDHPCGTVERWRQHRNERRKLRRQGVPEEELPPIDQACREAYEASRQAQKRVTPRKKIRHLRGLPRPETSASEHCGTAEGVRLHRQERRRLKAKGVPVAQLPTLCRRCEAEVLRHRVLRRMAKARAANGLAS